MGFEPTYDGFANHCLTTWLPHHGVDDSLHAWRRCQDGNGRLCVSESRKLAKEQEISVGKEVRIPDRKVYAPAPWFPRSSIPRPFAAAAF